jgi:hypothetical protein
MVYVGRPTFKNVFPAKKSKMFFPAKIQNVFPAKFQCGNSSVGNFRGLKQVDLPLMFQENKGKTKAVARD